MDRVINYPYAGIDFLIDADLKLVFLEANAVPGGIYVMSLANKLVFDLAPSLRDSILTIDLVREFVDMCIDYYDFVTNGECLKRAIVTTPMNGAPLLMPERISIYSYLRMRGIECYIVDRTAFRVENNTLMARIGSRVFHPQLIVRRNTAFPKGLRQVVVNRSEVGLITGSKYRTYRVIEKYLAGRGYLGKFIRVPKTYFSNRMDDALAKIDSILRDSDVAVVKPNSGSGGKHVYFIHNSADAESRIRKILNHCKSIVIQEAIETHRLRINGADYVYDVRVYGFLGRLIDLHARRPKEPVGTRDYMDYWAVSNISRGGIYVPIFSSEEFGVSRWTNRPQVVLPQKKILLDNHALLIDKKFMRVLETATMEIISAISQAADPRCL